jgi:hypothetical protein
MVDLRENGAEQNWLVTSALQYADWGMHSLQGSSPWLHDRFRYKETGERKTMLLTTVLLYTFGGNEVGLNQILNTCMPELSKDANYYF